MILATRTKGTLFVLLILAASLFLVVCGVKQTADPLSATNFKISESTSLYGANGEARHDFYLGETIRLSMDNLYPEWQTLVRVRKNGSKDCTCEECIGSVVIASDRNGSILDLEIWYNIGFRGNHKITDVAGDYTVHILQTSQNNPWINFIIQFTIHDTPPPTPYLYHADASGEYLGDGLLVGNDVYVKGDHAPGNAAVRLYVVKDQDSYTDGDVYGDESGGYETITTAADGVIPLTKVWPTASVPGAYDLIADVAPLGQYNDGDIICRNFYPGLLVQTPATLSDIITDIACDAYGNYSNLFSDLQSIWAKVNPLVRPDRLWEILELCHGNIFVAPHKAVWKQNDRLVHIETVGSMQSGVQVIHEPSSGAIVLNLVRGESKAGYRQPLRLWPGDYDMIVDLNDNGVYDPGIDLLDGGSQIGFSIFSTINPVPPAIKFIFHSLPDYDLTGTTIMRAIVLRSDHTPVPGITVYFNVGKGPGQVTPTSAVTDAEGMATTVFSGAQEAQWSIVRAMFVLDGVQYVARISLWGDMCNTHNQGVVIAD